MQGVTCITIDNLAADVKGCIARIVAHGTQMQVFSSGLTHVF